MAENKSLQEPTFPVKRKSDLDVQLQAPIKAQKLEEKKIAVENGSTDGESVTKTDLNGGVTVTEEANGGEKEEENLVAEISKLDKGKGIMVEEDTGVPLFRRDLKQVLIEGDGIRAGKGKGVMFEEEDYADYRFSSDDDDSEDSSSSSDDEDYVLSDSD